MSLFYYTLLGTFVLFNELYELLFNFIEEMEKMTLYCMLLSPALLRPLLSLNSSDSSSILQKISLRFVHFLLFFHVFRVEDG